MVVSVGSVTGAMVQVLAVAADAGGTATRASKTVVTPQIARAGRGVLMTRSDSFGGPGAGCDPAPGCGRAGRDPSQSALGDARVDRGRPCRGGMADRNPPESDAHHLNEGCAAAQRNVASRSGERCYIRKIHTKVQNF
ncbi:hypothetical protein GCM10009634_33840 [Saccharothrix xinjiangensis]